MGVVGDGEVSRKIDWAAAATWAGGPRPLARNQQPGSGELMLLFILVHCKTTDSSLETCWKLYCHSSSFILKAAKLGHRVASKVSREKTPRPGLQTLPLLITGHVGQLDS